MENGLPRHVAFIMDGNGRWAETRGMPRVFGHRAGVETVRAVTGFAVERGLPFLTLYAFSTENWSRPREEVEALMALFAEFLDAELDNLTAKRVRLRLIGARDGLPERLRKKFAGAENATRDNDGLVLTLAVNYGGRDEIVRAARKACEDFRGGGQAAGELDAGLFERYLDTAGIPDPDLIVRTAGEMRLSNFLVWQAAYAELLFCPKCWPDFSKDDFEEALAVYGERMRKFGSV